MDLGCEKMVFVYNIYGQAEGRKEDKSVTETIMTVIGAEIDQEQHLPTLIMGDINASLDKLHNLNELVDEEGCIDVGLHADWWGGDPEETTCESRPGRTPSRIDVIFASPEAALYIREVWVRKKPAIPTHSAVGANLSINAMQKERSYARTLPALKYFNEQGIRRELKDQKDEKEFAGAKKND